MDLHPHVYELVDRVVMVSPGDSVLSATKRMVEMHASSAVVAVGSKPQGILTSVDLYLNYSCALLSCIAMNLYSNWYPFFGSFSIPHHI